MLEIECIRMPLEAYDTLASPALTQASAGSENQTRMNGSPATMNRPHRHRFFWTTAAITVAITFILIMLAPQLLAENRSHDSERAISIIRDVLNFINLNYVDATTADTETLLEGALDGMLEAIEDPYTSFINSEEMDGLNDLSTGEFGGVGLHIRKVDNGVMVVAPIDGSPAHVAGISAGDLIVGIDDEDAVELNSADVVSRLRGAPGTSVTISLLRSGGAQLEITVTRTLIEIPTVRHALISPEIGYVIVSHFTSKTPNRVREALIELNESAQSLILDLRGNPGGLLSSVVEVADLFLDSGIIVTTHSRSEDQEYVASRQATIGDNDLPIIVLIDSSSASAAEILAGALKDHARAYLIGEQSFGKGSVQQIKHIEGDRAVKVTTARYYTPAGSKIDGIGIHPHKITEPELSKAEEEKLHNLGRSGLLHRFAADNPKLTNPALLRLMDEVAQEYYEFSEQLIRREIMRIISRTDPQAPIYDLNHDPSMIEAVRLLQTGSTIFDSLSDHLELKSSARTSINFRLDA